MFNSDVYNFLAMQANINVRAIAQGCSEYNITVVIKREDCVRALRAVHSRFYLSKTSIAVGIIGPGLIGATLLNQLRDQVFRYSIFHTILVCLPFVVGTRECFVVLIHMHCYHLLLKNHF